MKLEAEGMAPIAEPSEDQVRNLVLSLAMPRPTFASLNDAHGNYIQVAGGRPWCMVEWRQANPLVHYGATAKAVRSPYKDGAKIRSGAGEIALQADEWLLLKQAAELFLAFRAGKQFPDFVRWRTMNSKLGLSE
ncbi:hypothetical protein AB2M62_05870 [Sphingomonas sp. MMS12-HWE2-04]|uniref:hypothetical protein n=1 Tax=Sphingomonas sp. MMS12-HWE2-04 TaxID=3234199 RepID=UPI00384BC289